MNELIKELRELTGAGMMDIKEALTEANGDKDKTIELLRKKGLSKMSKKADRIAKEGLIFSYIHPGNKLGVLLEVNCETDFVARTDDYTNLVKELAIHIAASGPLYVSREEVPSEIVEKEREIVRAQATGKPEDVINKMIDGKLEKFYEEMCLLDQPYFKDPEKKISQLIVESVAKMGENVQVRRFARFVLGN
jgi:elongation factor Ts